MTSCGLWVWNEASISANQHEVYVANKCKSKRRANWKGLFNVHDSQFMVIKRKLCVASSTPKTNVKRNMERVKFDKTMWHTTYKCIKRTSSVWQIIYIICELNFHCGIATWHHDIKNPSKLSYIACFLIYSDFLIKSPNIAHI